MEAVHLFLQGFLFSLSLCFDLGMVNVALMRTGMQRGFKPSFLMGFGSCFGDLFYLTLALIGVSVILDIVIVKWALWIAGSAFLTYLTFKMLREAFRSKSFDTGSETVAAKSPLADFLTGAGLAVSSPTVIAWFALVAGPIIGGMKITDNYSLIYFIIGFFTAGLVWSFGVALISAWSGKMMSQAIVKWLSYASAVLFFYFAVKVFMNGLHDLF
ncbi:LysE family translocator [Paenibacillus sp. NEAU-GSW1]|uniref:LysE family translocator n=1 Tax=Paenibacillus sp. NEAU-GSW1 TaxID=2682486 RepID=UPI0012E1ED12|nr:LysE family transporter [Paenibacillus sp. NEAU-GSW1]MUT64649.1 lysine transporter LysE [Paenibacillus sp. NEAU-GSW1]